MRHVSKRTHCPHEPLRRRHQDRAQPTSGGEATSAWSRFGYKAAVMALLTTIKRDAAINREPHGGVSGRRGVL
jgi:hypothetical protein